VASRAVAIWDRRSGAFAALQSATPLGNDAVVSALAIDADAIYVGGEFAVAGLAPAANVARFSLADGSWTALGSGAGAGVDGPVAALAFAAGHLYVGGGFARAGGAPARNIARFTPATNAWANLGNGTNGVVHALAAAPGRIYAAGAFLTAGPVAAFRVAVWDTSTATWSSLGSGASIGVSDTAYALAATATDVYVGGSFGAIGAAAASRVARFDLGTRTWHALGANRTQGVRGGSFFSTAVYGLAASGNNVYATGDLTVAGSVPASFVAVFDRGSDAWLPVGGSGSTNGTNARGLAIAVTGREGLVAGAFTQAGAMPNNRLAVFTIAPSALFSDSFESSPAR
jgi:hypothetical protein